MTMLTPPSEVLAACPKFRILVLGNPESTKQEVFTKVFGVDLSKRFVDDAFSPNHDVEQELNLHGQNSRLAIHTCLNFSAGVESNYDRVRDFLALRASSATKQEDRIHCIWYCVASEEDRTVAELERRFFTGGLHSAAQGTPVVLVFTKYEEFVNQVKNDWSRDASEQGLSKVAVSHILRDLSARKFESHIGKKWDEVLNGSIPRVCVMSGDSDEDARSFEALAGVTLASLRERSVKYAFATAQRMSALISTRYCADTASEYFEVDTGHARKLHGVDIRDILPNFFSKAIQLFNMRDPTATLIADPNLLSRVLDATFDDSQKGLLNDCLRSSSTEPGSIILNSLSPHERAVVLAQILAGALLFLHRLADAQWPDDTLQAPHTITPATLSRHIEEIRHGRERREVLETVEASTVFTTCNLRQNIADLLVRAVERADRLREGAAGSHHPGAPRGLVVEDDSELREISLGFAGDKRPDDVVLPCGLTILPLT